MADVGRGVVKGLGGAGIGFLAGGPLGAAVGFLGGLAGELFGTDPEEVMRERKEEALQAIAVAYSTMREEAAERTQESAAIAAQAGTRQAIAQGREVQPSELAAARGASLAAGTREQGEIDAQEAAAIASLETQTALTTPIEPGAGEFIEEIGMQAAGFALNQKILDAYKSGQEVTPGQEEDYSNLLPEVIPAAGGTPFDVGVTREIGEGPQVSGRPEDQGLFGSLEGRSKAGTMGFSPNRTDFDFRRRLEGTLRGYGR